MSKVAIEKQDIVLQRHGHRLTVSPGASAGGDMPSVCDESNAVYVDPPMNIAEPSVRAPRQRSNAGRNIVPQLEEGVRDAPSAKRSLSCATSSVNGHGSCALRNWRASNAKPKKRRRRKASPHRRLSRPRPSPSRSAIPFRREATQARSTGKKSPAGAGLFLWDQIVAVGPRARSLMARAVS